MRLCVSIDEFLPLRHLLLAHVLQLALGNKHKITLLMILISKVGVNVDVFRIRRGHSHFGVIFEKFSLFLVHHKLCILYIEFWSRFSVDGYRRGEDCWRLHYLFLGYRLLEE